MSKSNAKVKHLAPVDPPPVPKVKAPPKAPKPVKVVSISESQLELVRKLREDVAFHATCGQAAETEWKRLVAVEMRALDVSLASGFCGDCGLVAAVGQLPACSCLQLRQQQAQRQQQQAQR